MKDIFKFILFLATVFLVACVCPPEGQTVYEASNDRVWYKIEGSGATSSIPVMKFEYDGHKYIMFGGGDARAVVHDPNCHCRNHYQAEPIYNDEYNY